MSKGKVWLVGAGPSDIGLFTIKGKLILEQSDVVVYDNLVGQSILSIIPEDAEKIYVGKRAGNHTKAQHEINEILLQKAIEGKKVVRLKGGDSFLFGRGGEELELLHKNNIDFEVVPGVTSAVSVPAYSGIPITHRDFCSSVHIITGHTKQGNVINYDALVKTNGTLIFLMGVNSLAEICSNLINAGMRKNMPAAIIEKGTTSKQKHIISNIENLYQESQKHNIGTPAIIVIGEVCKLSNDFQWYSKLPLSNTKIVITRPKEHISEISNKIRLLGAEVIEMPTIKTVTIPDNQKFIKCTECLANYDWILFTSPSGVNIFFEELKKLGKDIRQLYKAKIGAIGSATQKAIETKGIFVDVIPNSYTAVSFGKAVADRLKEYEKVLIPRASKGSKELIEELLKKKVFIDDIPIYDTIYQNSDIINIKSQFDILEVDYIVFTSASTVKGFVNTIQSLDYSKVTAICIGSQTANEARKYNMKVFVSETISIESIIELIIKLKNKG